MYGPLARFSWPRSICVPIASVYSVEFRFVMRIAMIAGLAVMAGLKEKM